MSVGLDAVTLEQAVRDADVSRSSAYAALSGDDQYSPQDMFQRAVLRRAIDERDITIQRLQEVVAGVIAEHGETMTSRQLLREMIRVGAGTNIEAVADSPSWQLVTALRAVLHSTSGRDRDEDLATWMDASEEELRDSTIAGVYRPLAEIAGLEPRPEYGELAYQYGEIGSAALSEGLAMRYSLAARRHLDGLPHRLDPGNDWTLYALLFEQIVQTFFLPIGRDTWDEDVPDA